MPPKALSANPPQFLDADGPDNNPYTYEDNDYRLYFSSPCIDTGWNESWMWGSVDVAGNVRIVRGIHSSKVDMGAYEYGSFVFKIIEMRKTAGNQLRITWNSAPGDTYIVYSADCLSIGSSLCMWIKEADVPSQGGTTFWTRNLPPGKIGFYQVQRPPQDL